MRLFKPRYEVWVAYAAGTPADSIIAAGHFRFLRDAESTAVWLNWRHRALCDILKSEPTMEFYILDTKTGKRVA